MVKKIVSLVQIVALMALCLTLYLDHNPSVAQGKFVKKMRESVASDEDREYIHFAALEDRRNAAALEDLGLNISLEGDDMGRDFSVSRSLIHCKAIVNKTLRALSAEHITPLTHLKLRMTDEGSRGLGGSNIVVLRCLKVTDAEFAAVLVHEIGHIVDLGMVKGDFFTGESGFEDFGKPIPNNDLSLEFYRISWANHETVSDGVTKADFVTGYAASDPFEDFAESYVMYTLQGEKFRSMARGNDALQKKYQFLKVNIFDNKEFGKDRVGEISGKRVYDSTVIPYEINEFFEN